MVRGAGAGHNTFIFTEVVVVVAGVGHNNFIKPARSAGAGFSRIKKIPKMYILEKRNFGTQISMLGLKNYQAQLFLCFEFSTRVHKNGPKNGPKFKKRRKMTKTIFPLGGHSI